MLNHFIISHVAWAVQVAVCEDFLDVLGEDVGAALEVGDGAGAIR